MSVRLSLFHPLRAPGLAAGWAALSCLAVVGCSDEGGGEGPSPSPPPAAAVLDDVPFQAAPDDAALWFNDVTHASGIGAFQQVNGHPQKLHISGPNGGGLALFDTNDDGRLDVFLTSASRLGGPPEGMPMPTNRLYRNGGDFKFEDVTDASGLHSQGAWAQGVAVADLDGDAHPELFVANWGPNALYHGSADGTFRERAADAGLDDGRWASAGAFFDADRDGDLDLYVTHYIAMDPSIRTDGVEEFTLSEWQGQRVMKGPRGLPAEGDAFFTNLGDATFVERTEEVGMKHPRPAFGFQPITTDIDHDGDVDLFVSNDSTANYLWRNAGDGTFMDDAVVAGLALDRDGKNQSCMGVAPGDLQGDGYGDFFITNFSDEMNVLYEATGDGFYEEGTIRWGLGGKNAILSLGWGTRLADFDHDGDLDLFHANGHVYPQADIVGKGYSYGQRNFVYVQDRPRHLQNITDEAGPGFGLVRASRGSAFGDLDGDGDLDLVVSNIDDHPTVLRNDTPSRGSALLMRLDGKGANRHAIGARVTVHVGAKAHLREVRTSSSFMAFEGRPLHIGLGDAVRADRVEITWPDGTSTTLSHSAETPLDGGHFLVIDANGGVSRTALSR